MNFNEDVFPLSVSLRPVFGPVFSNDRVEVESGKSYTNQNWSQPLQRGKVSFDARRPRDIAIVRQWHYNMRGRAIGFRVRDHGDYQVPDVNGTGVLVPISDTGGVYQLAKRYTRGAISFDRFIQKPEVGATSLYDDLTLKLLTTHYTIDESTGLITILFTPSGPPEDVLSWRGTFHVPMQFTSDALDVEIIDRNGTMFIQGVDQIGLSEMRDPFN
jgi:uncharacterized protein (TIGR02217 family)